MATRTLRIYKIISGSSSESFQIFFKKIIKRKKYFQALSLWFLGKGWVNLVENSFLKSQYFYTLFYNSRLVFSVYFSFNPIFKDEVD